MVHRAKTKDKSKTKVLLSGTKSLILKALTGINELIKSLFFPITTSELSNLLLLVGSIIDYIHDWSRSSATYQYLNMLNLSLSVVVSLHGDRLMPVTHTPHTRSDIRAEQTNVSC